MLKICIAEHICNRASGDAVLFEDSRDSEFRVAGKPFLMPSQIGSPCKCPQVRVLFDVDFAKDRVENNVLTVHGGIAEDNGRLDDVWSTYFE
jgi:hypothetical protein